MKKVVLKVGTSTLTAADGKLDRDYIFDLCRQMVEARALGWQVVMVSSGAIRAGADRLDLKKRPRLIPEKQAAAAVGQGLLHQMYTSALDQYGIASAQVLLTRGDFADHTRYLNAGNTLRTLLRFGAIPIINENDTVSVDEIRFGDNDMLAAMVAHLVDANLMALLTDVDGLCTSKPSPGKISEVIPVVTEITPEIEAMAAGGESDRGGTGGMSS
ncbi:MAG: glutamate 5-kinase, partial [Armatimonadota bacterium]